MEFLPTPSLRLGVLVGMIFEINYENVGWAVRML